MAVAAVLVPAILIPAAPLASVLFGWTLFSTRLVAPRLAAIALALAAIALVPAAIALVPAAHFRRILTADILRALSGLYRRIGVPIVGLGTVLTAVRPLRLRLAASILLFARSTAVSGRLLRFGLQDAIDQVFFARLRVATQAQGACDLLEFRKLLSLEF